MARTLNHEVSILNISGVDNDVKDVFTRDMVCDVTETSTVASRPYAAGDTFIWTDRKVYRAKTAISSGATLSAASNGNIEEAGSVENQLGTLKQALLTQALYFTSVACSATTGNFLTKSDANITADHVVAECTFANPSAITTDVTWTTASGSVTLNGTCASATTANLVLVKKGN